MNTFSFLRCPFRFRFWSYALIVASCTLALSGRAQTDSDEHLAPEAGHDFSAFRLDCDVFGWNKSFTEVASVNTEVRRYPGGKQRGEGFLLVYRLGHPWPIHNVVLHYITHANLKDPLPLEDVRKNLWLIEYQFQNMWPRRPMHHRPAGGMQVTVLMEPVPAQAFDSEGGKSKSPNTLAALKPNQTPHTMGAGTASEEACTPYVGFILDWHGQRRIMAMVPLDMHARCGSLSMDDKRVYWGRADIAAAMVRINFAANSQHEETARFVASASWQLATSIVLDIQSEGPLSYHIRQQINEKLLSFGQVRFFDGRTDRGLALSNQQALYPIRIRGTRKWLALGHYLGRLLGNDDIELIETQASGGEENELRTLTIEYASSSPAPPADKTPEEPPDTPRSSNPNSRVRPEHHSPIFGADVPKDFESYEPSSIQDPTLPNAQKTPQIRALDRGQYLDP